MNLLKKEAYFEKHGVCTFYDFANELSYDELLAVNGGCGGGSGSGAVVRTSQFPPVHEGDKIGLAEGGISRCGGGVFIYKVSENTVSTRLYSSEDKKCDPSELPITIPYTKPCVLDSCTMNRENIVAISQEDIENIKNQYFVKGRSF